MKILKVLTLSVAAICALSTVETVMATEWHVYSDVTYNLVNYSNKPIYYGASAVYPETGTEREDGQSGVSSITITPGDGQPAASTKNGQHGMLLPAQKGPTAANIEVQGSSYYNNKYHKGAGRHHHYYDGEVYSLQFSSQQSLVDLFYNGDLNTNGGFSPALKVNFGQIGESNAKSAVVACANGINFSDNATPTKNKHYTGTETISFYNRGSQPSSCVSSF